MGRNVSDSGINLRSVGTWKATHTRLCCTCLTGQSKEQENGMSRGVLGEEDIR